MSTPIVTLLVSSLALAGIYILISLGLTLIFGVMEIVNFAHGGFIMIGGYAALVVTNSFGVNPLVSIILVIPCMFALGYVLQSVMLEQLLDDLEMNSLLFTFGLSIVIQAVLSARFGNQPQFISVFDTPLPVNVGLANIVGGAGGYLVAGLLYVFLEKSEIGRIIRATSQVPDLAEASGINVTFVRSVTFGLASVLAGVGGVLYLLPYQVSPIGGERLLLFSFLIVTLGGLGSVRGAAVAGVIVATLQIWITYFIGSQTAFMLLLFGAVAILLVRPEGIFGEEVIT